MSIVEVKDSDAVFKCAACCLVPKDKSCSELEEENGLGDCNDGYHYEEVDNA